MGAERHPIVQFMDRQFFTIADTPKKILQEALCNYEAVYLQVNPQPIPLPLLHFEWGSSLRYETVIAIFFNPEEKKTVILREAHAPIILPNPILSIQQMFMNFESYHFKTNSEVSDPEQ